MPTGKQICEKQLLKVIDDLEKVKVNEEEIADFMTDIYRKLDWLSKEDLIKRMVSHEFNRFLDYYRGRDEIETATGSERGARSGERGDRNDRRSSRKAEPGFTRLFINLGKMDNFFPNELISLLNNNTRGRVELGRIDLMQKFSFFEVEEKEATNVVKALNRASWNGRKVSVEVAGDEGKEAPRGKRPGTAGSYGKKEFDSKKRSYKEDGKRNDATGKRSEKAESPANDKKKGKPSREERGYTKARGKKDDWKQFFQGNNPLFRAAFRTECNEHPNHFLLLFQVAGHQICRHVIASFICQFNYLSLFTNQVAVSLEDMVHSLTAARDIGYFLHVSNLQVFTELILGHATQHQDALCNLVNLLGGIVIHTLELLVQHKEAVSLDVPVHTAQIGVMYLEVGQ